VFGEANQLADDILDGIASASELGKPVGQDRAHARPNALASLGLARSQDRLGTLRRRAPELVPACAARSELQAWLDELMGHVLAAALRPAPHRYDASLSA
jgi:geranylgeranyl diphosphate synthase type II